MKNVSGYSVKIKHYNRIFNETVEIYREATDFFIKVCLSEWDAISAVKSNMEKMSYIEKLCHKTKVNFLPQYDFDGMFYKFPTYLRRAAINYALGVVSSYKSNLKNNPRTGLPKVGHTFPAMYRKLCFVRTGTYTARLKVFIRNTWDWIDVELKKGDVDYILKHCSDLKECAPILRKRGKEWFLDFAFEERVELHNTNISDQVVVAVDLGLNNACTCCVMTSEGTILDRKFLSLPKEEDSLMHALNRIKQAQQNGNRKTPRLWAKAKGISNDIAVKTANFIMDVAILWSADTIVFEHLDASGKKRGSKKQRLHHWRAQYVQSMVEHKVHHLSMRIARICAWNTSKLAYDGSGIVQRGIDGNYGICQFPSGKIYNCDLSASYNIGARYFIREILKSLSETARLDIEAKAPQCSKRITCTLSTLLSLNAVLVA